MLNKCTEAAEVCALFFFLLLLVIRLESSTNGFNGRARLLCFLVQRHSWLTFGRQLVSSQRRGVAVHRVEARRHQNHVRGKLVGDGHDNRPVETNDRNKVFIAGEKKKASQENSGDS